MGSRFATSDARTGFNESHTQKDMTAILHDILALCKPIVIEEVWNSMQELIARYDELSKEKIVEVRSGTYNVPDTFLLGDPLAQLFSTIINTLLTARGIRWPRAGF